MRAIPEFIQNGPFWLLVGFLTVVVCLRSQGTYWLGRLAAQGVIKAQDATRIPGAKRAATWLQGASLQRGMSAIDRWGLLIIPLSFLTIGFQTIVHLSAGVLRLHWLWYTLAAIPGYFAWGFLFGTLGLGAWQVIISASAGSRWAVVALMVAFALLVAFFAWRRFRAGRQALQQTGSAASVAS